MSIGMVLLIVLLILIVGGLPVYDRTRDWGWGPSGFLGTLLLVVLILVLLGRI